MAILRASGWLLETGAPHDALPPRRHTFASKALAAGEAPSWVAAMLEHTTPEMLFTVDARYIPNRTRRDGSAPLGRMAGARSAPGEAQEPPATALRL